LTSQQVSAFLQQYPQLAGIYQQILAVLVPGKDLSDIVTTVVQVLPTVISIISLFGKRSAEKFLLVPINWQVINICIVLLFFQIEIY
jgi:hypothetical protein